MPDAEAALRPSRDPVLAGCTSPVPGTEKIDNQDTITLPTAYRGSMILMSRGTSNGWVILGSHALAED